MGALWGLGFPGDFSKSTLHAWPLSDYWKEGFLTPLVIGTVLQVALSSLDGFACLFIWNIDQIYCFFFKCLCFPRVKVSCYLLLPVSHIYKGIKHNF